jgi:SWI/SNF chromatin-remodeling complex subunit SWI1
MNEAAVPNHNGNGFPHMNDPTAAGAMMDPSAFMAANPAQFNPAQFQNQQQMAAAMQNGPMRNASPGFQGPVYQTNSVIPSKRPRPREDSMAGSPRQNPGMLPTSRSETPQQSTFPGFQPGMPQQNAGQPSPYPHLQPSSSANASPSPIMGNQMRPGSVPQRVATASPHPFSPSAQQFGPQASPIPSEHGTPQPNQFIQNMPQAFNPNFAASPSPARQGPGQNAMGAVQMMPHQMGQMPQQMGQMPNQMFPPQMQQARNAAAMEQQKMAAYQMRLQQQLQGNMQMAAQMQAQTLAQGRGIMPNQPIAMANGQMQQGTMRPQPRPMPSRADPEQFMKNLTTFMAAKGLPLDQNPVVGNRVISLMMLFQAVQNKNGYKNTTTGNMWHHVANSLGFPPNQALEVPAPQALKTIYERNLLKFEEAWVSSQSRQKMQIAQQAMQSQGGLGSQGQATPTKQMPMQKMMAQGPPHMPPGPGQAPVKQISQGGQQPAVNGFSTPGMQPPHNQANAMQGHARNSLSRSVEPTPSHGGDFPMASPIPSKDRMMSLPMGGHGSMIASSTDQHAPPPERRFDVYEPRSRTMQDLTYGGRKISSLNGLGIELERWKPDIPPIQELGLIDIHALTRSLQSGIHGEVRLALDTLAAITNAPVPQLFLQLQFCDDLVDVLVECGEEQIELLAENTEELSDEIQMLSYEDVLRACTSDQVQLRKVPAFGTPEYELDRAVDRLICITTILRNLSFPGEGNQNHPILADEAVIKFLCVVIRYLGTRTMLLRTSMNTLDFMKDVVTFLSNIAASMEIPGREQALCLLQFLLAFAPTPGPTVADDKLFFPAYDPTLQPYLPHAVDCLAKLLARDEPNRSHYKNIFALDANSSTPYELLTRTFALAICSIPDQTKERHSVHLPSFVESRKPFLMQGLLAAEIVASLAPGYESGVTKAWLSCHNGFAQNLFRLIRALSMQYDTTAARGGARGQQRKDVDVMHIVVFGVSMLRRLAEKAKDPNDPGSSIPPNVLPPRDIVLALLQMGAPEWSSTGLLQNLIAYAALED